MGRLSPINNSTSENGAPVLKFRPYCIKRTLSSVFKPKALVISIPSLSFTLTEYSYDSLVPSFKTSSQIKTDVLLPLKSLTPTSVTNAPELSKLTSISSIDL
jgi:hypothetical protein